MARIKLKPEERRAHYREYQRKYKEEHKKGISEYRKKYNAAKKATLDLKFLPKYSEMATPNELDRFHFLMQQCKQLRLTGSL